MNGTNHNTNDEQGSTAIDEETGVGSATISPERDPVWASMETPDYGTDAASLRVTATWYDDEPPSVALTASIDGAATTLSMSPARADELAADLNEAAARAREGDHELGGRTDE